MHRDRRVHFDDLDAAITAERLTSEIRNCYETVDKGRKLLGRLYDKLQQPNIAGGTLDGYQRDYQLFIELDNLRDVLLQIAEKRKLYIEQLAKAEDIVWHDRNEMEDFLRIYESTEKRLQQEVEFFSRFPQKPQKLVVELQENSRVLGDLLSELKEQLVAEEKFLRRHHHSAATGGSFSASPRDRWSYIKRRRDDCYHDSKSRGSGEQRKRAEKGSALSDWGTDGYGVGDEDGRGYDIPSRDRGSEAFAASAGSDQTPEKREHVHSFQQRSSAGYGANSGDMDEYDTSSLSNRLKQLVKQSENVQKMISGFPREKSGEDGSRKEDPDCWSSRKIRSAVVSADAKSKEDARIGEDSRFRSVRRNVKFELSKEDLGNSKVSTDLRHALERCEEVERKILECSPLEVREKLLYNLNQLDEADRGLEDGRSSASSQRRIEKGTYINHARIRDDFLQCLDKIFLMEKSYGNAGDEIRNLKKDLREALKSRDDVELRLRTEIEKLKAKLDLKSKDVEFYNNRLLETKKSLFELKTKQEGDLKEAEKESDNARDKELKALKEECEKLKERVELKGKEVDALRKELEAAINELQNFKAEPASMARSAAAQDSVSRIVSLEEEVIRLRSTNEESIAEELGALLKVIEAAEAKQRKIDGEFSALREEYDSLKKDHARLVQENNELKGELHKTDTEHVDNLQERLEEFQLLLLAKNAEIEYLAKNTVKVADTTKEDYENEVQAKTEECNELRKKLEEYEEILAKNGGDTTQRLESMYQECLATVEQEREEKKSLEEDFQRQRQLYEDLLAECHNEMNVLKARQKDPDEVKPVLSKKEVLEALLSSERSPEEFAEILNKGFSGSSYAKETENLKRENEKLERKVFNFDKEVFAYQKEIESLKRRNKELKEKMDFMKSENFLLNKIREDDGNTRIRSYKELLQKKEDECSRLRMSLDESVGYEERDELLGRLREIHRELLQNDDAKGDLDFEELVGSLEKKDRENRRLKRQNRLLSETLGLSSPRRSTVLEKLVSGSEDYEHVSKLEEELNSMKEEDKELRLQMRELQHKLSGAEEVEKQLISCRKTVDDCERRCQNLAEENMSIRERLRQSQNEVKELNAQKRSKGTNEGEGEWMKENEALRDRLLMKQIEVEQLDSEVDRLKENLFKKENEAGKLKNLLETSTRATRKIEDLKEDAIEKEEAIKELKKALATVEKERKETNEALLSLKIRSEEEVRQFKDEVDKIQNELDVVASKRQEPTAESIGASEVDGGIKRHDRNKLIRKLQAENHQMAARILSLEDETTAITKIVADMERGHGHLTGILRGHLILQKDSTAKLLENSLHQYSDEFESCRKKFMAVEDRYDKERKHLTRRSFAWDLFGNATATVENISAILHEGLIKVEDDLERDFSSDEDFEARDYKSRLWILRRRLDDVEKRYRDLMLRAEELSIRLDAKTAEYDVTQDELEDATRVLEVNEVTMARMREDLHDALKESARLKNIMSQLKETNERNAITESELLRKETDHVSNAQAALKSLELEVRGLRDKLKIDDEEIKDLRRRLRDQEKQEVERVDRMKEHSKQDAERSEKEIGQLQRDLENAKKGSQESDERIRLLEDLLKKAEEKNASLEKYLQKARSDCRSDGIDHHGTIHMLRDDLKKLFKENESLKEELSEKKKTITSLAKDLRKAKVAVKEQLGTDRSLDEKVLDRAARDQILALKRRIRVLEMEKERLLKGVSIKERDQSFEEKRKSASPTKGATGGIRTEASVSFSADDDNVKSKDSNTAGDASDGVFGEEEAANADMSLGSIESFKDFSEDVKQEIELRDNLIQELEARVRELKMELATKSGGDRELPAAEEGPGASLVVDEKSIQQQDLICYRNENYRLKEQIRKQKDAPASYQIVQKDDMIKSQRIKLNELEGEVTQKDKQLKYLQKEVADLQKQAENGWRSKEIVLLETNNSKDPNVKSEFESLRSEVDSLKKTCDKQKKTIVHLETELKAVSVEPKETRPIIQDEPDIKQHIESTVEASFEFPTEQDSDVKEPKRGPQFINISESKQSKSKGGDLSGGAKSKTFSRIPISPRPKQAKVSQSKDVQKEDLSVSEKTNEELEKKIQEQDEDIKTLLQSVEMFERDVESLQKRAIERDTLEGKLKKLEAEMRSLKAKNVKLQDQVKDTKTHEAKLRDLEDRVQRLSSDNKEMEQQLKKDKKKQNEDAERKKAQLDAATKKMTSLQGKIDEMKKMLEQKTVQLDVVRDELHITDQGDEKSLRKAIRESIKKKVLAGEAKASSDARKDFESKIQKLEDDNQNLLSDLKSYNRDAATKQPETEDLESSLQEVTLERDIAQSELEELKERLESLELEKEDLRTRNIALEITQDAVSRINDSRTDNRDADRDHGVAVLLKDVWSTLKSLLQDFGVLKEEDIAAVMSENVSGKTGLERVVTEMERVNQLLEEHPVDVSENLNKQTAANFELEKKVEEFRRIIEETNLRVADLENEVAENEKGDEIGHKLLLDQVASLKSQVGKCEREKGELDAEIGKRQQYVERLSEQVKFLEKQVSIKDSENSEVRQRALDSEDDLEQMKNRVEELEDDYNRLLQFGMRLEDAAEEDSKREKTQDDQKQLVSLKEQIQSLEEENRALQDQLEAVTAKGNMEDKKEDRAKLEEAVYRLELDKDDLQKRLSEYSEAIEDNERLEEQLKDSEKKVQNLEDAMFRLEIEKANLQKSQEQGDVFVAGEKQNLLERIVELEDGNSKLEEAILRLDAEREGLRKRVNELASDDAKGDVNDLTLLLIDNEEKIADLQQEKRDLVAKQEELQQAIDDMLASPRSGSEEEGETKEEENDIFIGGPKAWKRRLVAAYRDLREKSVDIAMLKMIVESKNVEIDLLSKELGDDSLSINESFGDDLISKSGRFEFQQQLRGTVRMLQEEVKMKGAEISSLREEIAALQNRLQLQDSSGESRIAVRVNGKDGNEVEIENLQAEIKKLKESLVTKEEQYDSLCDQLFGGDPLVTANQNEDLKSQLEETQSALIEREKKYDELEENYEVVYNELTKMKAGVGENEAHDSKLDSHENKIVELEKALSDYEEKCRLLSNDFDELEDKYREEMNYASTHIAQLMMQIGELEEQLQAMRQQRKEDPDNESSSVNEVKILENRLRDSEEDLKRKKELITNLKETLANFYQNADDQSDALAAELKRIAKENKGLQDQLDLQKERYETELASMRVSMTDVKGEHVTSLKEDFERVCNDKVGLQVKVSELSEKVVKLQDKVEELTEANEKLGRRGQSNENENSTDLLDFTA